MKRIMKRTYSSATKRIKETLKKDIDYNRHRLGDLPDFLVRLHDLLDTTLTTEARGLRLYRANASVRRPRRSGARFPVTVADDRRTRPDDKRISDFRCAQSPSFRRVVAARTPNGTEPKPRWKRGSTYRRETSVVFFLLAGHAVIRYDAIRHGTARHGARLTGHDTGRNTHARTRYDAIACVNKRDGEGEGVEGEEVELVEVARESLLAEQPFQPLPSVRDTDILQVQQSKRIVSEPIYAKLTDREFSRSSSARSDLNLIRSSFRISEFRRAVTGTFAPNYSHVYAAFRQMAVGRSHTFGKQPWIRSRGSCPAKTRGRSRPEPRHDEAVERC